ncbi:MAG: hypothetical protein HC796_11675 [Synechococcaceae cyanobacterium RL_1_2]|nr:hypothetical protein [Synechococcaceae cyanobacterium RL_1_2]
MLNFYLNNLLLTARKSKKEDGFTLLEILLAIFITGFVVAGIGTAVISVMGSNDKSQRAVQQRSELNRAFAYMAEDVKGRGQFWPVILMRAPI